MKSPELRKELSELVLHKRGIRINLQLSLIESEDEISLRSPNELAERITALKFIRDFVMSDEAQKALIRDVININQLRTCFSANELSTIFSTPAQDDARPLDLRSYSGEALSFLMWASSLQKNIGMPDGQRSPSDIDTLIAELPPPLAQISDRIKLRSKSEILDWADLLYRLHWAVRHAHITAKPTPGRLNADAVHEWHKAVNWLIRFDDEDDWDKVSTETAG